MGIQKASVFLAWRYFFSQKSTHAVNIITAVAVIGIGLVVASMIVVLSVFNGFEAFTTSQLSYLSAPYKIERQDETPFNKLEVVGLLETHFPNTQWSGIVQASGLFSYEGNQVFGKLMGVDSVYNQVVNIDHYIYDGRFALDSMQTAWAVMGIGVAAKLNAGVGYAEPLQVTVPKRKGHYSLMLPSKNFLRKTFPISGVLRTDQPEDETLVYVPLHELQELLQLSDEEVTSIVLKNLDNKAFHSLKSILPQGFHVLNRIQQHSDTYKVLKIEKWVSFALLLFILLLSLFGVISTLGMLIVEKKDDFGTLYRLGATNQLIKQLILIEGGLLTLSGLVLGLVLGIGLTLSQEHWGWFKLGGGATNVFLLDAYPVKLLWQDLFYVVLIITAIGALSSYIAYTTFYKQQTGYGNK